MGAMSAGRSFHSVFARWFWNDCPVGVLASGTAPSSLGGGGRFATAAVVLSATGRAVGCSDDDGKELRTEADTSRWTSHAESGRSFM